MRAFIVTIGIIMACGSTGYAQNMYRTDDSNTLEAVRPSPPKIATNSASLNFTHPDWKLKREEEEFRKREEIAQAFSERTKKEQENLNFRNELKLGAIVIFLVISILINIYKRT